MSGFWDSATRLSYIGPHMPPKRISTAALPLRTQPVGGGGAKVKTAAAGGTVPAKTSRAGDKKVFVDAKQFDPARLEIEAPTTTRTGSIWVPIKYDGQRLLLHTGVVHCPFGASQYEDKVSPTSFSMQISIDQDNDNALAVANVMKMVKDKLLEQLPLLVETRSGKIDFVDTCQQKDEQYSPLARVTLPLFKNKFTTQVIRRKRDGNGEPVPLTLQTWHKVLPKDGVIVDGAIRLAGAYIHEDDDAPAARAGSSWQWHSIRLADDNELMPAERKAENSAVIAALLDAVAPSSNDDAGGGAGTKRKAQQQQAPTAESKRAKTVHEDCEITEAEADQIDDAEAGV